MAITLTAVTPTGRAELNKVKPVGACSFLFLMIIPGNEFGSWGKRSGDVVSLGTDTSSFNTSSGTSCVKKFR